MPDSKSAVKFDCSIAENLGHLLSMYFAPPHPLSNNSPLLPCPLLQTAPHFLIRDARVIDVSNIHHIAEVLGPYSQGSPALSILSFPFVSSLRVQVFRLLWRARSRPT